MRGMPISETGHGEIPGRGNFSGWQRGGVSDQPCFLDTHGHSVFLHSWAAQS